MSITNEQKQAYLDGRRYFYAITPSYYAKSNQLDAKKQKEAKEKRQKKLLDYLTNAKKSAIKRGMYNQKAYKYTVAEADKNV